MGISRQQHETKTFLNRSLMLCNIEIRYTVHFMVLNHNMNKHTARRTLHKIIFCQRDTSKNNILFSLSLCYCCVYCLFINMCRRCCIRFMSVYSKCNLDSMLHIPYLLMYGCCIDNIFHSCVPCVQMRINSKD